MLQAGTRLMYINTVRRHNAAVIDLLGFEWI